uniref:NADAR domain-containing protein n=1 Tax=Haemonchus contortus TaxID=6289 RepID=A0A7I5E7G9_HAECO|nr:Conserved hypothetical protein CHP02464 domain containing protein [Haemonchus contortus]
MSSSFRSNFVSWRTSNSLSNPYTHTYGNGYEAGGYNPEYPSVHNNIGGSTLYQQQYLPSQAEYNPVYPSYTKPVYSREPTQSYPTRRVASQLNRPAHNRNIRSTPRAKKIKIVKISKSTAKAKPSGSVQRSTVESSSSSSRLCKAEETPHSSDDQKPGGIRAASPIQPDISVLKIISPKRNSKQPRKIQALNSEAGPRRGTPGSSSGVRKNMSYMPFGAGMPRGGFGMMRGGRGGRGGRRYISKPNNNPMDIPFVPLPEDAPAISLTIDPDNFICFHGFSSVFTTQHTFPVLIDGKIYESGDHYYQIQKVHDLCGTVSEKLTETVRDENGRRLDGKVGFSEHRDKSFSQVAKEVIRLNNVDRKKVDEWRYTKGLDAMQKALMAKVSQSVVLRQALSESGKKILVHAFPGDSIYGAGCRQAQVKKWCESMKANGATTIRIPATFPLTAETVFNCPNFAQGRNVLGVILMQLREMLRENKVPIVDLSSVFDSLRIGTNNVCDASMDDQDCGDGFAIGGGSIQAKIGGGTKA